MWGIPVGRVPKPTFLWSARGTNWTSRAGLAMSVHAGRKSQHRLLEARGRHVSTLSHLLGFRSGLFWSVCDPDNDGSFNARNIS